MERLAVRGNLLLGDRLRPGAVVIEDGKIAEVVREQGDWALPPRVLDGAIVAPGFIDLQVNGGFGVDIGTDPAAIRTVAERLPESGVTAFLATVISSQPAYYREVFAAFAALGEADGARPLGLHLEGPYLSPARKGAHQAELLEPADPGLFEDLIASDAVKLMTLAPERLGAIERIGRLRERGIAVSLGHTDARYEDFAAGVDAGATMATHVYNAMSPFGHRAPGAIGAALVDERVTVGLIADGVHSHPASLRLATRAKGPAGIALVTDMMAAAGMPPGTYPLSGQIVNTDGKAARLTDGTLAGATLLMDQAVRNMVAWADVAPVEALRMATEVPARVLGRTDIGQIAVGATADLVVLDEGLQVMATIVGGQILYEAGRKDAETGR